MSYTIKEVSGIQMSVDNDIYFFFTICVTGLKDLI